MLVNDSALFIKGFLWAAIYVCYLAVPPSSNAVDDIVVPDHYGVYAFYNDHLVEMHRHPVSKTAYLGEQYGGDLIHTVGGQRLPATNISFVIYSPDAKALATQDITIHRVTRIAAQNVLSGWGHGDKFKVVDKPTWRVNLKQGWRLQAAPVSSSNEMVHLTLSEMSPGRMMLRIGRALYSFSIPGRVNPKDDCEVRTASIMRVQYKPCPSQFLPRPENPSGLYKRYIKDATTEYKKGNFQEALSHLEKAKQHPDADKGEVLYFQAVLQAALGRTNTAYVTLHASFSEHHPEERLASAKIVAASLNITAGSFSSALRDLETAERISRNRYKHLIPTVYTMRYIAHLGNGDSNAKAAFCRKACNVDMRELTELTRYITGRTSDWHSLSYEALQFAAYHHCYRGEVETARAVFTKIMEYGDKKLGYHDARKALERIESKAFCTSL
ncbi:tetratricopeptide repeat protein [Kordiimonas pumila]|uniref:Tetratricopeptide repeat protein n=1 Tax=Kordiimonas pumila TaxID=2161677 RepID=A0ABV7DAI5_9PROT|nr:hypothetical protein [Kordiimonas pumila]